MPIDRVRGRISVSRRRSTVHQAFAILLFLFLFLGPCFLASRLDRHDAYDEEADYQ